MSLVTEKRMVRKTIYIRKVLCKQCGYYHQFEGRRHELDKIVEEFYKKGGCGVNKPLFT